jgi:siroheme synthase
VVFVTGHHGVHADETNWESLVSSRSTLAIYMPGRNYSQIAERLGEAGISSSTPCAVVSHCGQSSQRVFFSSLNQLGSQSLPSPSLLIVGECAAPAAVSQVSNSAIDIVPDTHANQ